MVDVSFLRRAVEVERTEVGRVVGVAVFGKEGSMFNYLDVAKSASRDDGPAGDSWINACYNV